MDPRHPQLLANLMGHRETIMGMTRHGMKRMKKGALIKASFEETSVVLHNAARFCRYIITILKKLERIFLTVNAIGRIGSKEYPRP